MYTHCACCGQELHRIVQTYPAKYNLPDLVQVTCWTHGCPVFGRTLNPEDHQTLCKDKKEGKES